MSSSPPSIIVVVSSISPIIVVSSVPPLVSVHPIVAIVIVSLIVHDHKSISSPSAFFGLVAAAKVHVAEEHEEQDCSCAEESILGDIVVLVEEGEELIVAVVGGLAVIDVSKPKDEVWDVVGARTP